MPPEWAEKLRTFVLGRRNDALHAVRSLSSVSPALALIASRQFEAMDQLQQAGREPAAGVCAVDGGGLMVQDREGGVRLSGVLPLVTTAACSSLLITQAGRAWLVPLASTGVTVTPTPAIGFRPAGLSEVKLDCEVAAADSCEPAGADAGPRLYLALALGAGDYLSRRASEHAAGRVQFAGQMLDTEGRDSIAKLGAVKALVSRIEAWRLALETLFDAHSAFPLPHSPFDLLCASLAADAFGPENGCMAYDAGQVFGGFAYSEDDLLARSTGTAASSGS